MRISDWSSDVCSSDPDELDHHGNLELRHQLARPVEGFLEFVGALHADRLAAEPLGHRHVIDAVLAEVRRVHVLEGELHVVVHVEAPLGLPDRSEEHTSELQSLMRTSYAVFCLKKKN